MQTVNVSFFRPTWIMIYFSTRSPTHRAINPAWQSLIPATVYNVRESGAGFCFCAFSKELLTNTLYFFPPQNYHIAIIHLHVIFKRIESSEKLGDTTNLFKNNANKRRRKKYFRLCESTETFSAAKWMFLLPKFHQKTAKLKRKGVQLVNLELRSVQFLPHAVSSVNIYEAHCNVTFNFIVAL